MEITEKIADGIWFYEFNPLSQISNKGQFTIKAGKAGLPIAILPMPLGGINSKEKQEANAQLIAEAGTVKNETGFSPRQLAEQKAELVEQLKEAIRILRIEGWRDSDYRIKLMLKAIKQANQ